MVLLVTIGLVIISAVALVVGFVQDSVGWIYGSIGCSIAAAVILIISARTGRAAPVAAGVGPSILDDDFGATIVSGDSGFPISDYDELLVTEIIPLLGALDVIELEQVRAREQAGKARTSVLRRIDLEIEDRAGAPAAGTLTESVLSEEEPSLDDALVGADGTGGGLEFDDEPFPIEDYDDLRVGEVLPLLPQLYADELDLVAARERAGAGRAAVLDRIAELLAGDEETMAVDIVEEPVTKAPAKKAAAKKAAAKKAAPLKKSATQQSARTATPTKATKKAATTKSAAKAPAKKAPAKKAAAKKAPTKKAAR